METITLYLDKRATNKSGLYPIKIRITDNRQSYYIATGIKVREENWDSDTKTVVDSWDATRYNAHLMLKVCDIQKCFAKLELSGKLGEMSTEDKVELAKRVAQFGEQESYESMTRGEFYRTYLHVIETRNTEGTKHVYVTALNNLMKYDKGVTDKRFSDITEDYVKGFVAHRKSLKKANNSILNDIKGIALVFNEAIRLGKAQKNPCDGIKVQRGVTVHRNIPASDLRAIFNGVYDKYDKPYIDLFKLSFLLRGINLADLCTVGPKDIVNGRLVYERQKTHTLYSVKVEPEVYEIMRRYPSKTRLMNMLEGKDRMSLNVCINERLKRMFGITSYAARHSVASIAAELDISIDIISQLLGHKSFGKAITMVYVSYTNDKVDEAMRRVIDYVLYGRK